MQKERKEGRKKEIKCSVSKCIDIYTTLSFMILFIMVINKMWCVHLINGVPSIPGNV